jgi:hypothetical protein
MRGWNYVHSAEARCGARSRMFFVLGSAVGCGKRQSLRYCIAELGHGCTSRAQKTPAFLTRAGVFFSTTRHPRRSRYLSKLITKRDLVANPYA